MSTRDLAEWRTGICRAAGPQHTLRAHLRKQERAGEIQVGWQHASLNPRSGQLTVPYVRLKSASVIRRERTLRWTALWVGALALLTGVLYALWTIRVLIVSAVLLLGIAALVLRFLPHLSRGCSGLHCSGCRG